MGSRPVGAGACSAQRIRGARRSTAFLRRRRNIQWLPVLMMRRRLCRTARLLLVLQLLSGIAPAGLNLCVADDGHTTLEFSHAELPCLRDLERHHPGQTAFAPHEFEQHACEDVPLLENRPCRISDVVRLGPPPVASAAPCVAAPAASSLAGCVTTSGGPPLELASRALSTVILLI